MGMLHYQLDQLRGLTGFVSSLLITEGDRLKGLEEMQRAAQKGILLREAAQIQLASIYLFYERQPAKALSFIQPLRRQYPDNYNFHFLEGMMMADLGRIAEARSIAADIEKKMKAGKPVYPPELQPRYDHLMGRIHFRQAEYETAESYFHKVMQNKAVYNMRTAARAELGIGMIHDIRQERRQAEERYRRAMKTEGADGSTQLDCAKYLKTPYRPNG
jgi:Flp pilus assembly protein TadD